MPNRGAHALVVVGFSAKLRYDPPMLFLTPAKPVNKMLDVNEQTCAVASFRARFALAPGVFLAVAWLVFAPNAAWAHALHMFVSVEGKVISGDVYYSDGKPAINAAVTVTRPSFETHELTTDEEGLFSFTASVPGPHVVVADSNDGHRVQYTIEVGKVFDDGAVTTHDPPHTGATAMPPVASDANLDAAVRAAVREEIRPLREDLNRFQNTARIRDIVAGIGYIVGVFGLLAWVQARRRRGDNT